VNDTDLGSKCRYLRQRTFLILAHRRIDLGNAGREIREVWKMDCAIKVCGVQLRPVFGGVEPLDGTVARVQGRLHEIEIARFLPDEMAVRAERRAEFHPPESRRRLEKRSATSRRPHGHRRSAERSVRVHH
jgi:hypothetical protein